MIKAVIFDFFGVLTGEGTKSYAKTFYAHDEAKIAKTQALQNQMNLGVASYEEYAQGLAELGGTDLTTVQKYLEGHQANRPLLEYIRHSLKPKYKLGIISNAGANWVDEIIGPEEAKLFDDIILSYEVSLIKPDPEIYKLSLKNLNVAAPEAVFIDDIERYCQGARDVGMKAIWYEEFDQFKKELEEILAAGANN